MAAQLKEIVDRLNAEPFNLDLSLLVFDEKDPLELMEILKKARQHLDVGKRVFSGSLENLSLSKQK